MSGPGEVFWMMRVDDRSLLHCHCFLLLGTGQSKVFLVEEYSYTPE